MELLNSDRLGKDGSGVGARCELKWSEEEMGRKSHVERGGELRPEL